MNNQIVKLMVRDYLNISKKLVELKDEELYFIGEHPNRDFWTDDEDREYDELLEDIEKLQRKFAELGVQLDIIVKD